MVELKHHPGVIELPRCHEWQEGVLCDQSHGVSEPGVSCQCWHVVKRLSMKIPGAVNRRSPGIRVPVKSDRLILEAGDKWGDERSSTATGDGDGSGRDVKDSPRPDVRAHLEGRAHLDRLYARGKRHGVLSWSDNS